MTFFLLENPINLNNHKKNINVSSHLFLFDCLLIYHYYNNGNIIINIVMAILKFKNVAHVGKGLDYVGIHHFGVLCEDLDGTIDTLEELEAPCILKQDENSPDNFYETKFVGPDGVVFDVSEHAWIGAATAQEKEIDLEELLAAE